MMTRRTKQTWAETLTGLAPLPDELRRAPRERQQKKVMESVLGWLFIAIGIVVLGVALALTVRLRLRIIDRPQLPPLAELAPTLYLVAGVGVVGIGSLVFGAAIADRETAMPALKGIVGLMIKARRS